MLTNSVAEEKWNPRKHVANEGLVAKETAMLSRRSTEYCDVVSMETRRSYRSYRLVAKVTVERCQR